MRTLKWLFPMCAAWLHTAALTLESAPVSAPQPTLKERFSQQQDDAQQTRDYIDRHVILFLCQSDQERAVGTDSTVIQGKTAVPWVFGFSLAVDTRLSRYAYCNHCWITERNILDLQKLPSRGTPAQLGGVTPNARSSYSLGQERGQTAAPSGPPAGRFNEVTREGDTLIFEGITPRRMELNLKTSEIFVELHPNAAIKRSVCKTKKFWEQRVR